MKNKAIDFFIVFILILAVLAIPGHKASIEQVWKAADRPVVVIDPGHGGIDGGAEGSDGTVEKDINLDIALKLQTYLENEGIRVIMTRVSDKCLYKDDGKSAIRTLKTRDMHERKRIIDEAGADLAVSIHLNSFTQDTSVKGAQVFYPSEGDPSVVERSKKAAELIQKGLNEKVNTDKKRTELGKNDVFLLQDASTPIVITECGFLSNGSDLANLKDNNHQEKISKSIKLSVCKYLSETGKKTQ